MKKILRILSVMGLVFFISSRAAAQTVEKLPMRTVDSHPAVHRTIPAALPIKSGGGEKTVTLTQPGAMKPILPPMRTGNATGSGGNKAIPASAGSAKLPIKGAGTGGTNMQ
jgi:hypothetical protein